jgi:hypothetical protein
LIVVAVWEKELVEVKQNNKEMKSILGYLSRQAVVEIS